MAMIGEHGLDTRTGGQLRVNCLKCNEPFREGLEDSFIRLDGTLVHVSCRTFDEYFEALLGHALQAHGPEHSANNTEVDGEASDGYAACVKGRHDEVHS
jgi:hypothetical protein